MKGTLIGAALGFLFKKHKDNTAKDEKLHSSVEGAFKELEESVARHAKNSEERIKKLPPDQQANIERLKKKFEDD